MSDGGSSQSQAGRDYRDGSYPDFVGSQTRAEGGQGLLLEVVQGGFSAACVLPSVCIPVFITPVVSFARLICNNDNTVESCPLKEQEPFESQTCSAESEPFSSFPVLSSSHPAPLFRSPARSQATAGSLCAEQDFKGTKKGKKKRGKIGKAKAREAKQSKAKHCCPFVCIPPFPWESGAKEPK